MTASFLIARQAARLGAVALCLILSASVIAASGNYQVTNLTADVPGVAPNTDPNLVNGWGIVMSPTSPAWVSDAGTGKSTVYDGTGALKRTVTIPAVNGIDPGAPTGIVFNLGASPTSTDFLVAGAGTAALFLWATEDGGVAAWAGGASATIKFAAADGAVYKGLAMAGDGVSHFRLYAADFHNGKIDVIDSNFARTSVPGGFADTTIPTGYAPFNVMNIQGNLYVTYAVRKPGTNDDLAGNGLGFVNVFDSDGFLIARVASHGKLNAPWGIALAPQGFGKFSSHLLVGNFGDGTINAYNPAKKFAFAGQLRASNGHVLTIDGLWGIAFGNGFQQQPTDTLFFAAGPAEEAHGLFGKIEPAPSQPHAAD
ncbi:MAG: TIGR03118 family protein [Pseudomonadota bacterium]|nr:TIGR03118 family protein [Pseudomonadota bacterium]